MGLDRYPQRIRQTFWLTEGLLREMQVKAIRSAERNHRDPDRGTYMIKHLLPIEVEVVL